MVRGPQSEQGSRRWPGVSGWKAGSLLCSVEVTVQPLCNAKNFMAELQHRRSFPWNIF